MTEIGGSQGFVGQPVKMENSRFIRVSVSDEMESHKGRHLAPTYTSIGECTLIHMGDCVNGAGEGMEEGWTV